MAFDYCLMARRFSIATRPMVGYRDRMSIAGANTTSNTVDVDGLRLHYLEAGRGDAVLLLHGWPTSSFLWRNVVPWIGETNRAIALDLPGFGRSDKPLDASYSFRFYTGVLEGFLAALGIERTALAVHDLGGPIGLHWASQNPDRLTRLALLNTLVYPQASWAVIAFVLACRTPGLRSLLASPRGLELAMRIGVTDHSRLTPEVMRGVLEPFETEPARVALLKAGHGLHPGGFAEIVRWLPTVRVPVRILYGARDSILPDVAKTMRRVARDVPHAETTVLEQCGHFLQEDRPDEVARELAEFFSQPSSRAGPA
jgi:haloalkane dehalogenase